MPALHDLKYRRGLRKVLIYQTDEFVVVEAGKVEDLSWAETLYLWLYGILVPLNITALFLGGHYGALTLFQVRFSRCSVGQSLHRIGS